MKKIIGTALPLFALRRADGRRDIPHGTFADAPLFIDWLHRTRQRAWQLLPLSQTHLEEGSAKTHVPSPYKGYGIGLDPRYLKGLPPEVPTAVEWRRFRRATAAWLPDYALFCALRDRFGTDDWTRWPDGLRARKPAHLRAWRRRLSAAIRRHALDQWQAHRAFDRLRSRARAAGIALFGDLPFYIPLRSPLVWANQRCFDLGARGLPRRVSGVPDSPRAHYGRQVWGHPLYRWTSKTSRRAVLRLWTLRLRYHGGLYDHVRLDHAKGLFRYGAIDPKNPRRDAVLAGPGSPALARIIRTARAAGLEPFAEDSGDWLDDLRATLRRLRVPGIRIFRFAYNERRKAVEHEYADVEAYPKNCLAFTSTHDTVPLMAYLKLLTAAEKRVLCRHVGVSYHRSNPTLAKRLRAAVLKSPAQYVIVPLQDWLLTIDRINVPGTEKPRGDKNWRYRMTAPIEKLPRKIS